MMLGQPAHQAFHAPLTAKAGRARQVGSDKQNLHRQRITADAAGAVGAVGAIRPAKPGMSTSIKIVTAMLQVTTSAINTGSLYSPSGACTVLFGLRPSSR